MCIDIGYGWVAALDGLKKFGSYGWSSGRRNLVLRDMREFRS